MFCRRLAAVLLVIGGLFVAFPSAAEAHTYTGSYTVRMYDCGLSNKYACQAHYLLAVDGGAYGPLWKVQHSHGCTSQDGLFTKWVYMMFRIKNHGGVVVWSASGHEFSNHEHTTQWCGQSAGTHEFYPNIHVARGNNIFELQTSSYYGNGWYSYTSFYPNA
jgi:hypothetical protein